MKKIYESPDGGKTVYEREFMDYSKRKLIKPRTKKILNTMKKFIRKQGK